MEASRSDSHAADEAFRMLDAFSSVGVAHLDVTFLDLDGAKRGFGRQQSVRRLKNSLPHLLPGLKERRQSLVIRPSAPKDVTLVQLDDLDSDKLRRAASASFLTLETSPGNHQAWLAVSGLENPKEYARRLRKGASADLSASGAARVAGTLNYKRKYEPDFPCVRILEAHPGRILTSAEIEALGLLAPPLPAARAAPLRVSSLRDRSLPDYARCLAGAPLNHGQTGPDVSRADFFWCLMAAQRGWSIDTIAARLMQLSPKANENGESYARLTAENAAAAASRGQANAR